MVKWLLVIQLILCWVSPGWSRQLSSQEIQMTKKKAIKRLKARKIGFEEYLAQQNQREKKRLSVADKQKVRRQKYYEKKQLARKKFTREQRKFPKRDYIKFIESRNKRNDKLEKARQAYGVMQRELRKIYNNKKYRIDGKKEYKL